MQPKKNAPLQAYERFNKLSAIIFIIAFAVIGYDLWLVSKAAQPPVHVSISATQFSPQNVQVEVGQTVIWTNHDTTAHWIASDPYPQDNKLSSLNSYGPISANSSYSYTFDHSGTFTYHDELHANQLKGAVIVK